LIINKLRKDSFNTSNPIAMLQTRLDDEKETRDGNQKEQKSIG
jgi:hypothetical protein